MISEQPCGGRFELGPSGSGGLVLGRSIMYPRLAPDWDGAENATTQCAMVSQLSSTFSIWAFPVPEKLQRVLGALTESYWLP